MKNFKSTRITQVHEICEKCVLAWWKFILNPPKLPFPHIFYKFLGYIHEIYIEYSINPGFESCTLFNTWTAPSRTWKNPGNFGFWGVKTPCGVMWNFPQIGYFADWLTYFNTQLVPTPTFAFFIMNKRLKVDVLYPATYSVKLPNSATLNSIMLILLGF